MKNTEKYTEIGPKEKQPKKREKWINREEYHRKETEQTQGKPGQRGGGGGN